ncbi:TetR/AcrR family transcriptional regulator [Nocardioides ferulae]|uniref:TetR/AcrR family transcriptional regulator n=1 Tax=Nocardioides ferulae TaxID=2340821 RepID=UPI000EAFE032|nr:TetR/AcrR family transcriptional regulator [Nocardioides ferulae]
MPRITGDSLVEHRAQLRGRVFEAFAELMAERSFDAISMAQIAERAGLGRTAIYHHFHDKEQVVLGFAADGTEAYLEQLEVALGEVDDPAERLRTYVRHQVENSHQFHMGLGPQLYAVLSPAAQVAIRDHVVQVEAALRGILTDGLERGAFRVDDLDATLSLIQACLAPRGLPLPAVEAFVLRAVGADG